MRWKILRAPMMALTMTLRPSSVSTMSAAPRAASVAPAHEAFCQQQNVLVCPSSEIDSFMARTSKVQTHESLQKKCSLGCTEGSEEMTR